MMIDVDERSISEYIGETRLILPDEFELSTITDEDSVKIFSYDILGHLVMDSEKMKEGSDGQFIYYLYCFPHTFEVEIDSHARTICITIDTLVTHDKKALSVLDDIAHFSDFLLHFQHFYVF